jgi:hypothetical protein
MIGIELVYDRESREPWPALAAEVRRACVQKGLIIEVGGHFRNVARFLPPLVITRALLLQGIELFVEAVRETEQTLRRREALAAGERRVGSRTALTPPTTRHPAPDQRSRGSALR